MLTHGFKISDENILSADQVGAVVGGELTSTGITLLFLTCCNDSLLEFSIPI